MPDRIAVLAAVTDLIILRRRPGGVLRVGIDGVDGSGKSARRFVTPGATIGRNGATTAATITHSRSVKDRG